MGRKTFVFNLEWAETLRAFPAEVRYEVYDAIIEYAQSGTPPELKPLAKMAFAFIKSEMDSSIDAMEESATLSEKRRRAGRKGLLSRWAKDSAAAAAEDAKAEEAAADAADTLLTDDDDTLQSDSKNGKTFGKTLANIAKHSKSVKEREKEREKDKEKESFPPAPPYKEKEKEKEKEKDKELELSKIASSSLCHFALGNPTIDSDNDEGDADARAIVAYYNSLISERKANLVACRVLTDRRRQMISGRLREYGADAVRRMLDKAVASSFLNYDATNAPVNIDWLFRPNNFPKVLEGSYDNRPPQQQKASEYGRIEISNDPHKFDKWKNGWDTE